MSTDATQSAAAAILSQFLPFDPLDPAFRDDPYPTYRKLVDEGGVVRAGVGAWVVTGYRECTAVLRDSRFGHGNATLVSTQITRDPDGNLIKPFIYMDPPDHTRIRSLVSKAFTARVVEQFRPRAIEIVTDLLRTAKAGAGDGPVDLMAALAYPLPSILIGELLGVPAEDHERFRTWSNALARGLDPDFMLTPEQIEERTTARAEFDAYFYELAERRRAEPTGDLVSEMVAVEDGGERLTRGELVSACRLLLSAGYVSTAHLIGNGTLALLRNPDQLAWLREHQDQVAGVVEELLRYDAPVQMTSVREALSNAEIGGHSVPKGAPVLLLVGAANRDPAVFPDPDRLDVTRQGKNLGFGLGIHFCAGASLARLTTQVALLGLIRFDLRLAEENPPHIENFVLRGLAELPVELTERA